MLIVIVFKSWCFITKLFERYKPLGTKKGFIKCILKALNLTISPRFSLGDEYRLDFQQQRKPEYKPEGMGITVTAPEG
jgi:hypothetical protein